MESMTCWVGRQVICRAKDGHGCCNGMCLGNQEKERIPHLLSHDFVGFLVMFLLLIKFRNCRKVPPSISEDAL